MTKRLLATTTLLLTVPLTFWLTGWHWQTTTPGNYPLYLITQTAGKYSILPISAGLYALLWWTHRRGEARALLLVSLLAIGSTQVAKVLLKPLIAEPRPYVVAMTDADLSRIHAFYAQPRSERRAYVTHYYADNATPTYLSAHRASETGYSFPSGHSLFATSWALLFAGIIGYANRRRRLVSTAVTLWAMLVMTSRVTLGLHYPIDLAGAILLACAISLPLLHAWQRRHHSPRLRRLLSYLTASPQNL